MVFTHELKEKGVYFFFPDEEPSYIAICLGEGLDALNIPVYANKNFCERQGSGFLFRKSQLDLESIALCIIAFHNSRTTTIERILNSVSKTNDENIVFLSQSDENRSVVIRNHMPLFAVHENKFVQIPGNRIPWAFGISSHVLNMSANTPKMLSRKKVLLRNFRPSVNQSVRLALDLCLVPQLQKHFKIDSDLDDGERFVNTHYERLKSYLGCLAYGGHFAEDLTKNKFFKNNYHIPWRLLKEPVITRWDSWRFWESLACGCLTVQLDFDKYGFELPVKPINWKHYIGIELDNINQNVERMMDEFDLLAEIAESGKKWAIKNYSPKMVAYRFIEKMMQLKSENKCSSNSPDNHEETNSSLTGISR